MSKYKINKKEKLSDEEIQKYKDFEKVKKNYKRTVEPLYKYRLNKKKNMQRLFFLLLFGWLIYMVITADEEAQNPENNNKDSIENINK